MTAPLVTWGGGGIIASDREGPSTPGGMTAPLLRQGSISALACSPAAERRRVRVHPNDGRGDSTPPGLQVDGIQPRFRGVGARRRLPDSPSLRGHPDPALLPWACAHSHQPINLLHKPVVHQALLRKRGCSISPSATPYADNTRYHHRRYILPSAPPRWQVFPRSRRPAAWHPLAPGPPPPPHAHGASAPGTAQWL